MVAKLGSIERTAGSPTGHESVTTEPFGLEFRNEVTELVHDILRRSYVSQRELTQSEARRWGLTLEQLVAAAVSHHVMKKVDKEYV